MLNRFFVSPLQTEARSIGYYRRQLARQTPPITISKKSFAIVTSLLMPSFVLSAPPAEIFERVKDSVFVVKVSDEQNRPKSQGSAVLLASGKLATNCHLLKDGHRFEVGQRGRYVQATRGAGDDKRDACLLEAEQLGGKPVSMGHSSTLKVGAPIYTIGSPQGFELSMSDGIVSQLRGGPPPVIQITAAISPGSSGGGVFDAEGRLVGLTTLYIEGGQNLNFALPVEWLKDLQSAPNKATRNELTSAGKEQSGEEFSNHGSLLYEGRLLEALNLAKAWVKAEPNNVDSWLALGLSYQLLNDTSNAIEALGKATRIDPEHYGAWYGLGLNLSAQKKYDKAASAFRKAVEINPKVSPAWWGIGDVYLRQDRPSNAIIPFQEAIKFASETTNKAELWYGLGQSFHGTKRYAEAIQAYQSATRIKADDWRYWDALARSHSALFQVKESIKALGQAVSLDQNQPAVWAALGADYVVMGDFSSALQIVSILRGMDPKRAEQLDKFVSMSMNRKK